MAKIAQDVLDILGRMEIEENVLKLTCGQLDPKQYKKVDLVLQAMGGKWNRKRGGHLFDGDPCDKLEMVLLTGEILRPQSFGYFPTPAPLAAQLVELAELEPEHLVLEPQAGQGGLAEAIARIIPKDNIHCVELLENHVSILQAKGFAAQEGDFLTIDPRPVYDRVVMNPPFSRQADITHVLHAYRFLKPGGRLTAIMSAGTTFRSDRKTLAFREFLDQRGWHEPLPEESFKDSGTSVNTIRVLLDKPHDEDVDAAATARPLIIPHVACAPTLTPLAPHSQPIREDAGGGLFPWYQGGAAA